MSQLSQNYVDKVVRWTYGQVDLARMNMPLAGQFRARLALECYMLWQQNKSSNIRRMVINIAARDYNTLMQNAEMGNEEAKAMVEALGIRRNEQGVVSARSITNVSNDIWLINQLVGRLSVAKNHIQRAVYEDNIEWLIGFAKKTGNVTAMREAQRNLEKINNDFKEDANPADALKPGVERNITNDISIIKPDRSNYSPEQLKDFAKRIGAKFEDVQEFIEGQDGMMVPADSEEGDEESEGQVFDSSEEDQTTCPHDSSEEYDPFAR